MFGRLKIYTVHIKPEGGLAQKPVFIREGFNIFAFCFTGLWALYQRLWLPCLVILLVNLFLIALLKMHVLHEVSTGFLDIGFHFFVGWQANDWLRTRLRKDGYIHADVTAADSLLRAEQRYFERTLAAAAS
jgi:hypothetical protein